MRTGVAVGFFDGVHLGHRAILANAAAALTFSRHPMSVLAPARTPRLLMSVEDRLEAIRATGVETVVALEFDQALAAMTPDDFVRRHLAPLAGPGRLIRCGADWRFGRGGSGDAEFLRRLGYSVDRVADVAFSGARISSTRIRTTLEAGDIPAANAMLGKMFSATGRVRKGKGVGRALGFPTVNVALDALNGPAFVRLPYGVYSVAVGGTRALANYGLAPTMGAAAWTQPVLEIHVPHATDVAGADGRPLTVAFERFLRPERRFPSPEALARQIAADIAAFEASVR